MHDLGSKQKQRQIPWPLHKTRLNSLGEEEQIFPMIPLIRCSLSTHILTSYRFANALTLNTSDIPPLFQSRIEATNLQGTPFTHIYTPTLKIKGLWNAQPEAPKSNPMYENALPFQLIRPISEREQEAINSGIYFLN